MIVFRLWTLPRHVLVVLVRAYQWILRPILGSNCRFEPSCSEYAVAALRGHGAMRGSLLAGRRLLRCNPWVSGGFDPVPCACATRPTPTSVMTAE